MIGKTVETTITYLEMTEPPEHVPAQPCGFSLTLLRAIDIPLPYYRYLYSAVGAEWLWFERLLLDDARLARKVHRDGVEITVVYADGVPAGYYELDFSAGATVNLVYFGLTPEWSGRGIGPWLLGAAIGEAWARGAGRVTVNTCTLDHPAALPLYGKLGFRPYRRETRLLTVPARVSIPDHIAARLAS